MKPEYLTERLRLRPLVQADAVWVAALRSDPEVTRHVPGEYAVGAWARAWAESSIALCSRSGAFGYWAVERRGEAGALGWVALKKLVGTEEIEVGYRLHPESWGRGVATEAARRIVQHGFEEAGVDRIVAVTTRSNLASQRVIQKLGFGLERTLVLNGIEWLNYGIGRAVCTEGGVMRGIRT